VATSRSRRRLWAFGAGVALVATVLYTTGGVVSGLRTAGGLARDSFANAGRYLASTMKLRGRSDAFFVSMQASIADFHAALDAHKAPETDGKFGAALVELCERISEQLPKRSGLRPEPRPRGSASWNSAKRLSPDNRITRLAALGRWCSSTRHERNVV